MTKDRKFNANLDRQISLWLLNQEKIRCSEQPIEQNRVSMECVYGVEKFFENKIL